MRLESLEARQMLAAGLSDFLDSDSAWPEPAAMELGSVVPGLVHHWNLDEGPDWHDDAFLAVSSASVAHDSVGGNDAVLMQMGGDSWVSGQQFTGLEFDGSEDYLGAGEDLGAVLGGDASLAFWVRTEQAGGADAVSTPGIAGSLASGKNGIQWGRIDSTGRMALVVNGVVAARTAQAVNDGQWHFVVFTRDAASGRADAYVDGRLTDAGTGPAGAVSTTFASLGRIENASGGGFFQGRLDQVYVFDRPISQDLVAQLFGNYAPKTWDVHTAGVTGQSFSTASVLYAAFDPEQDPLRVSGFTRPAHGTVLNNGDGTFTYTSQPGYVGSDSFEAIVEDGRSGFARTTVKLDIQPAGLKDKFVAEYENFAPVTAAGAPIEFNSWRVPRALDADGDGLQDLLVGAAGSVWFYHNRGTAQQPEFAAGALVHAAGEPITTGANESPIAVTDLTGDGVHDLIVSDASRRVRVYPGLESAELPPVYAAPRFLKDLDGGDLVLPDRRFDVGDWNDDGLPDLVTGSWAGDMLLYVNAGTAAAPRFPALGTTILAEAYNVYPRLLDLSGSGHVEFVRGINWDGEIRFWIDPVLDSRPLSLWFTGTFSVTDAEGRTPELHHLTDGPIVDFADFDGDGTLDLVLGGHAGTGVYVAYGQRRTISGYLAEIEAIYDAHPDDLGAALHANGMELLNRWKRATQGIVNLRRMAPRDAWPQIVAEFAAHVAKYPFLRLQHLDTSVYHTVPSMVAQNIMLLHHLMPDTPAHRQQVADVFGMEGVYRDLFLNFAMVVGDNLLCTDGQLESLRQFLATHPRESYPDDLITMNLIFDDGRDGIVEWFDGAKNTYGLDVGLESYAWLPDLAAAISAVRPDANIASDLFTEVVGHEATHSLDRYVRSRANRDLARRWGQFLVLAAGADVIPGVDGWIDWTATQVHFQSAGLWDPQVQTWDAAWDSYWESGPGAGFRHLSFMRGSIDWFLENPQESLATQGSQHWADSEGRILGAVDRFRRGFATNLTEVVTFLDFLSVGLNRIPLFEIDPAPGQAIWEVTYADVQRDDRGYITRIATGERVYEFQVNEQGVYTDVTTNVVVGKDDGVIVFQDQTSFIDVLGNDYRLEGGDANFVLRSVNSPSHGEAVATGNVVRYRPEPGYLGTDTFTYTAVDDRGLPLSATATVTVTDGRGALLETWYGISGAVPADLESDPRFPHHPDTVVTLDALEAPRNRAEGFGSRMRAWLVAPTTGEYRFYLASDDGSELRLSSDADPAHVKTIAEVPGWVGPRQWDSYPQQQSAGIRLVAGRLYYIEAVHKEGGGEDHLSVGWTVPGSTTISVIPGEHLLGTAPSASPTARLVDPLFGGEASDRTLNARGYLDIAYFGAGASGLDPGSILDARPELVLSGEGAAGVVLGGVPQLVPGTTAIYRYPFTGAFTPGPVNVHLVTNSLSDLAGNSNQAGDAGAFTVDAEPISPRSWQNPKHPCDVNDDGIISAADVLYLINEINRTSARRLLMPPSPTDRPPPYLDPTGDNQLTSGDVLYVINYINAESEAWLLGGHSSDWGEGESNCPKSVERTLAVVRRNSDKPAKKIAAAIHHAVSDFSEDHLVRDNVNVLAIKCPGDDDPLAGE